MFMTIYIGARDLNGMPVGTHQFLLITTDKVIPVKIDGKLITPKVLGKGIKGYVIGAQNRNRRLQVEFFERSDFIAVKEYFGGIEKSFFQSDFDAELKEVSFSNSELLSQVRLFQLINAFTINQSLDPIKYPSAGFGFNSNSWAGSMIKHSGGVVDTDFSGLDIFHDRLIPITYFLPICPSASRPVLNK